MSVEIPDAVTVTELVAAFEQQGYVMSFSVEPEGQVRCGSCHTASRAEDVPVDGIARAEGPSDPADMAVVAVVRCPWCRVEGTLVAGYGPAASPDDSDVVARLRDERDDAARAAVFDEPTT